MSLANPACHQDVIMEYCFGKSADKLNAPDFDITFHQAVVNGAKNNFLMRQFPWILWTMKRMPTWLLLWMNPDLSSFIQMHRVSIFDHVPTRTS